MSLPEAIHKVKEELQLYRTERVERWMDRIKVGRTDYNPSISVGDNLKALVAQKNLPHFYAEINGRQVLHVVVDLGRGKPTRQALRSVLRRVGSQTIELNYKASTAKNPYGHVAVRVGGGALYDLTGSQGVATLPRVLERALRLVRGTSHLTLARRRSLRRFMESRKDSPHASANVFLGMLYGASPEEIRQTRDLYEQRLGQVKEFSVSGGDAAQGVYSCAQYLTDSVPFLNRRGIPSNVGAKGTASAGHNSPELQAVVVYRMPRATEDQLRQLP